MSPIALALKGVVAENTCHALRVIDIILKQQAAKRCCRWSTGLCTKMHVYHPNGICHVYVDKSANMEMAKRIVLDARIDYPAACNVMETLLAHKDLVETAPLNELMMELRGEGVKLYGGPRITSVQNISEACAFHHEYNSMACTIEIVDDVHDAIEHIHCHGSAHTDCIVTEDHEAADIFLHQVDSAVVIHNASTRFCDGAHFGLGAEVGISTSKIHSRGPVRVEGLLTTRWAGRNR